MKKRFRYIYKMTAEYYADEAKTLKQNEITEILQRIKLENDLAEEKARFEELTYSLNEAKRERASCTTPTSEDIANNDFKDDIKAKELDELISCLEESISQSLQQQQFLRNEIRACEARIRYIQQNEKNLTEEITSRLFDYDQNADLLMIDTPIFQDTVQMIASVNEYERDVMHTALNILEIDSEKMASEITAHAMSKNENINFDLLKTAFMAARISLIAAVGRESAIFALLAEKVYLPMTDKLIDFQSKGSNDDLKRLVQVSFNLFSRGVSIAERLPPLSDRPEKKTIMDRIVDTKNYVVDSVKYAVMGNYYEGQPTKLGMALSFGGGFIPIVGQTADIRDITYDIKNIDSVSAAQVFTDSVAFVPFGDIIGDGWKELTQVKMGTLPGDPIKYIGDSAADLAYDGIVHLGKQMDNIPIKYDHSNYINNSTVPQDSFDSIPFIPNPILSNGFNFQKYNDIVYYANHYLPDAIPKTQKQTYFFTDYNFRLGKTPDLNNKAVRWEDQAKRGECLCLPRDPTGDLARVIHSAEKRGVLYKNAVADFSPFSIFNTTITISEDFIKETPIKSMRLKMGGSYYQADQKMADFLNKHHDYAAALGIRPGKNGFDRKCISAFRKQYKYTWHELNDCKTVQLIPTMLNGPHFKHCGMWGEYNVMLNRKNNIK